MTARVIGRFLIIVVETSVEIMIYYISIVKTCLLITKHISLVFRLFVNTSLLELTYVSWKTISYGLFKIIEALRIINTNV